MPAMNNFITTSCDDLWGHVQHSSLGAYEKVIVSSKKLADTKITENQVSLMIEHEVLWLDVSVSNIRHFMAIVQRR